MYISCIPNISIIQNQLSNLFRRKKSIFLFVHQYNLSNIALWAKKFLFECDINASTILLFHEYEFLIYLEAVFIFR